MSAKPKKEIPPLWTNNDDAPLFPDASFLADGIGQVCRQGQPNEENGNLTASEMLTSRSVH
jgi:hypothetical protein